VRLNTSAGVGGAAADARQGLTLVHISAQPEPVQNQYTPNTS
jgi:hypothetical protein